jgi:hypothetical protein
VKKIDPRQWFKATDAASIRFNIVLVFIVLCAALIRLRWLSIPFERDEGEYAYIGQLLLQGVPPFEGAYTMKLPGTSFMYALFMLLFGQTVAAIHFGLLLVNAGTIFLVALLAKKLRDGQAGLYAAAIYAAISLGSKVLGFAAHATHFVVFFALSGILLMLAGIDPVDRRKIFLGGLCLGLSVLMKQPGLFFAVFAILWTVFAFAHTRQFSEMWKSAALMATGVLVPLVVLMALLFLWGTFDRFWLFGVEYAREYAKLTSLEQGIREISPMIQGIGGEFPLLWGLILVSIGGIFFGTKSKHIFFLFGFLLFSFAAICPGLYFRSHYFILLYPSVAVAAGVGIQNLGTSVRGRYRSVLMVILPPLLLISSVLQGAISEKWYFFNGTPAEISRMIYGRNPFNEASKIGEYIERNTQPNERIMVLGSEPEIYFYAHRRSASGYIYMYSFTEPQPFALRMQKEMIREVERTRPKYILVVAILMSWKEYNPQISELLTWVEEYFKLNYSLVGVADMVGNDITEWYGFGDSPLIPPASGKYRIYLYGR